MPKQVSFFLWTAANDGILTIDNLIKKCQFLVNMCYLCCCDEESVDHLFLHCKFFHALWCEVFAAFGIQWVMPRPVNSFFFMWRNWFGKHLSTIWNMVPACLMWLVWQECNARIFLRQGENFGTSKMFNFSNSVSLGSCFGVYELYCCI